ncbi:MAG: ATP synthase F1 subunit gamma [bacterium]|nr:ATP synthase F1 subunit gamma [bacterium]
MATGIINLKRRIRSVNNTLKTTSAMQLISAVKMRRSVETAFRSRAFVAEAQAVLGRILAQGGSHQLLRSRTVKKVLLIAATADRGLCGSFNSDVVRRTRTIAAEHRQQGRMVVLITVGRKGAAALRHLDGVELLAAFDHLGDSLPYLQASPIGRLVLEEYQSGRVDAVQVIYQHFHSTINQEVRVAGLIPVVPAEPSDATFIAVKPSSGEYYFEPSSEQVLDALLPYLINMNLYQWLLEANASEHAARMVAMKNATDAGGDLVQELTFTANQVRQARITAEIAEIAAGAAAIG